jgi:hypothetical protein
MADVIKLTRAETVTITLTRDEAFALDELAESAMDRLVSSLALRKKYEKLDCSMEAAASACDKVRQAILSDPNPLPWKQIIKEMK